MAKRAKICNEDCFHCPYPDCIRDGMSMREYRESARRDRKLLSDECKEKRAAYRREWYRANREKVLARMHEYYRANRERRAVRDRKYYEANREKILARKREKYRKDLEKEDGKA